MKIPDPFIIRLRHQIEDKTNFKIRNIADSQKISNLLLDEKLHISAHTIARIFGVLKPYRTPYRETLNILSKFLNYNNWDDYCTNKTHLHTDQNFFLDKSSDDFSLVILRLTLENNDFKSIKIILDKLYIYPEEYFLRSVGQLLGDYARSSVIRDQLLKFLGKTTIGHIYFYENFVDENNFNNYFSDALVKYYLPNLDSDYKKLFVYAFIINQTAYKEKLPSKYILPFEKIIKKLDKHKCHYHELSRWLECVIIIDGLNGTLEETYENHLKMLVEYCLLYSDFENAWIVSRPLKALLFFDMKIDVYKNIEFNLIIEDLLKKQKKEVENVALYLIQFYWVLRSLHIDNIITYLPFRIHNINNKHHSEEISIIEYGLASLFATGENKKIIDDNLEIFCKEKGTAWILKAII